MTNGQLFTPEAWSHWQKLHQSIKIVAISIDAATADIYRVGRRGGKLQKPLDNLAFISQLRADGQLDCLEICLVVQKLNFHEIPDFIRLGKVFGVDPISFAHFCDWGTYGPEDPMVFLGNISLSISSTP